jgi:hypothetical protein
VRVHQQREAVFVDPAAEEADETTRLPLIGGVGGVELVEGVAADDVVGLGDDDAL